VNIKQARAAMAHHAFCGISRQHLGDLIEELAPRWEARCESGRHERRGGARQREIGAGPKYGLVLIDRVLVTLVHLRTGLTHAALGVIYEVGSSTIGRAISEVRPLLAARGFAVPDRPGVRLRTLEDVFAYAEAEQVTLRIDGMETQVRRPQANRPGRRAFVSGKRKQNTIKTTTISDHQGRTLWSGAERPGRMHDQTALRTEGIAEQFHQHPGVKAEVDDGYRGLANEFPGQVSAPPKKPKGLDDDDAPLSERYGWRPRSETPPVLAPDLRRARQRRTPPVAPSPAIHRTARDLRRNPPRRRGPGLRPCCPAGHPAQAQHRARARPHHGLLNHPPAEPPGQHAPTSIAGQPVNCWQRRPSRPGFRLQYRQDPLIVRREDRRRHARHGTVCPATALRAGSATADSGSASTSATVAQASTRRCSARSTSPSAVCTRSASSRNRGIFSRTLFSRASSNPSTDGTRHLREPHERTNHAHLSRVNRSGVDQGSIFWKDRVRYGEAIPQGAQGAGRASGPGDS
jgi:hypothetical protein